MAQRTPTRVGNPGSGFTVGERGIDPVDVAIEHYPDGIYSLPSVSYLTTCLGYPAKPLSPPHQLFAQPPRDKFCEDYTIGATQVGPSARPGYVCRNCPCNFMNALVNRHGAVAPVPIRQWNYAYGLMDELKRDRPWDTGAVDPLDRRQWMLKWPLSKRLSILESEKFDDVMPWRTKASLKRDSSNKPWTKARMIQAYYNQATQSEYGPWMYALQKAVFDWFNAHAEVSGIRMTMASGQPPSVMADWMSRVHLRFGSRPYFRERDGKNWDSTMGKWAYDIFIDLCRSVDRGLAEYVEAGYAAMGFAFFKRGVFKYRLVGGTKSGFSQTTVFNSLINMLIAFETLRFHGCPGEILVAGDDLLVATGVDPTGHAEYEAGFGIVPESRVFRDYLDVTFISSCWIAGEFGFRFVPILGRLLARLGVAVNPPPPKKHAVYWSSIVAGLTTVVGQLPLYTDFLRAAVSGSIPLGKDYNMWVAQYGGDPIDDHMYGELRRKYDFTVDEFEELRRYLASIPARPVLFKHHLVDRVLDKDLADLLARPLASAGAA